MAHPTQKQFPEELYVLGGGTALQKDIYAVYNPTAAAINAVVKGNIFTESSGSYVASAAANTIAVPSGATLYGTFSSCSGDGLICYVK